jgi:hypothetical protein
MLRLVAAVWTLLDDFKTLCEIQALLRLERRAITLQAVRFFPLTDTQVNLICCRWLLCERNDPSRGVSSHDAPARVL